MTKKLKIYCDGGARGNPGPAAAAFVVFEDGGKVIYKTSKYLGETTNNVAEYNSVIIALSWLLKNQSLLKSKDVDFFLDSELVVKQLSGKFKIKSKNLAELFFLIRDMEKKLSIAIKYHSVPRTKNKLADYLVNKALDEEEKRVSRH